jgi:integrase
MRRSQLLGLRWDAVDFDRSTVGVDRRRVKVGFAMVETSGTKTTAGRRHIDIDPATVRILRAWRAKQTEERLAWGPGRTDTGLVACISPSSFQA